MARHIPQSKFDALIAAFREHPGVYRTAARIAGVDKTTARTAWERGWPDRGWPAIGTLFAGEQLRARAQLAKEAESLSKKELVENILAAGAAPDSAIRNQAKKDGVSIRVEEAQAIRQARSNAMGLMGVTARLLTGVLKLAQGAQRQLEAEAIRGFVDPMKVAKLLSSLAHSTIRGAEAAQLSMQMERLWLGQPTEIVGQVNLATDMTLEEVDKRLAAARTAVERARTRGLTLLTGGEQPGDAGAKGPEAPEGSQSTGL